MYDISYMYDVYIRIISTLLNVETKSFGSYQPWVISIVLSIFIEVILKNKQLNIRTKKYIYIYITV